MDFFRDISASPDRRFVLIVALVVLILVIGLLVATNTNLKVLVPGFIQQWFENRKVTQSGLVLWDSKAGLATSGLVVPDTLSTVAAIPCDKYTMSVEMIWYNTRVLPRENAPYRHILHRGSNELAPLATAQTPTLGCGARRFGTLPARGLPSRMNPGIFADPVTNDLILFVTTVRATDPHEMIRIPDIPLDKPFKLTVVLQRNYVEVYINCHLEVTKVLGAEAAIVPKTWYGLSGNANAMAQIQNLTLWKEPLSATNIMTGCGSPIVFSAKRPTCPGFLDIDSTIGAASTATSAAGATGASSTGTGTTIKYGDSLSICK